MAASWSDEGIPIDPDQTESAGGRSGADLGAIAVGGALGALARYQVSRWLVVRPGHVPWSTLFVNLTGSFALGIITIVLVERFPTNRYARPFVAVGAIGAYTTMSTLSVDTDTLLRDGHATTALVYLILSLVGGLAAAWGGILLGQRAVAATRGARP
jgi:fluoride exporter